MTSYFVEFAIASEEQFRQLEAVVNALCEAKRANLFPPEDYWLAFFDTKARSSFWFPTEAEPKDLEQRWHDPSLETPWDFGSMIEAFKNGEYELLGCCRISDQSARLEFNPYSSPYGGAGCMKALVAAFGHQVTAVSD